MREFCAKLALSIYFYLSKGARDMMAMLFAQRVILGKTEFEKVPAAVTDAAMAGGQSGKHDNISLIAIKRN